MGFPQHLMYSMGVVLMILVSPALSQCGGTPCDNTYEPQCGDNGVSYSNPCEFTLAQCYNASLQLYSEGPCPDVAKGIFDGGLDIFGDDDDTNNNSDDDNNEELLWLLLLLLLPFLLSCSCLPLLLGGSRGGGYGGCGGGCGGCGMMPYYRSVDPNGSVTAAAAQQNSCEESREQAGNEKGTSYADCYPPVPSNANSSYVC